MNRFTRVLIVGCLVGFLGSCRQGTSVAAESPTTAPTTVATLTGPPDPNVDPVPHWIWGTEAARDKEDRYFRQTFDVPTGTTIRRAWVWGVADNTMAVFINGKRVARSTDYTQAEQVDIRSFVKPGKNFIAVRCQNADGPAGLCIKLTVRTSDDHMLQLVSDASWKTSNVPGKNWQTPAGDSDGWADARIVANYGDEPWGKPVAVATNEATSVDNITLPKGFKAELLYSVPKNSEGSWVSMTPDPKGRLYVSDQNGSLFRVTPPTNDEPIDVEELNLDIGQAQGLLWAFDSLYVVVNSAKVPNTSGLYRLRDTDGDDVLDSITQLKQFFNRSHDGPGTSEHGPHAVVLGPDQKLYVVAGNFTNLPDGVDPNSPARHWSEDQLLERMPDGKGHDPNIYAPGSWICRTDPKTDPEAKHWEVMAMGMRNAYDFAFANNGEIFTFDSDMEWDIGSPWYRPTRVCDVVSGGEFGWRNGSGKFPTYYPDSVPPVLNMGPGSPTGVTFGYGAKFPEKYQRAFFVSDWAYGKIHAVYLKPDGAGFSAESEPFLIGRPFDVTDVVINHDGAMYITIGGRGTQSGLYRVTYVGDESTAPVADATAPAATTATPANAATQPATNLFALRRQLESFHTRRDPSAVDFAWPLLKHEDRFIRYAARVAIEAQDPQQCVERAFASADPTTTSLAMIAVCRVANASYQPRVLQTLSTLDLPKLSEQQLREALRAYELCLIRMGHPISATGSGIAGRLDALYPNASENVNHELCQLLAYFESPSVVSKSLALMDKGETQDDKLYYLFNLRNVHAGWTPEYRDRYFDALNKAQQEYNGGASFKLFWEHCRRDAVATLGDNEKVALGDKLKTPMELGFATGPSPATHYKFVKSWTVDELTPKLDALKSGRSFSNGKTAFNALGCIKCHRFASEGGGSGPDISGAGNRFQPVDLLEAIITPSKVISDQYQATEIITKKKQVYVGTISEENDEVVVVRSSPLSTATETVKKDQIAERRPSKVSIMPQGLIDVLHENDVLDLLAYIRSAGDVIEPTDGIIGIGSGGAYASSAAKALVAHSSMTAKAIVEAALKIAGEVCIYTNTNIKVESL